MGPDSSQDGLGSLTSNDLNRSLNCSITNGEFTMRPILKSKPTKSHPADPTQTLTCPAVSVCGEYLKRGTIFQPCFVGNDNVKGCQYQEIVIKGRILRFEKSQ